MLKKIFVFISCLTFLNFGFMYELKNDFEVKLCDENKNDSIWQHSIINDDVYYFKYYQIGNKASWKIMENGKEQNGSNYPYFLDKNNKYYINSKNKKYHANINGKNTKEFPYIKDVFMTEDGKHFGLDIGGNLVIDNIIIPGQSDYLQITKPENKLGFAFSTTINNKTVYMKDLKPFGEGYDKIYTFFYATKGNFYFIAAKGQNIFLVDNKGKETFLDKKWRITYFKIDKILGNTPETMVIKVNTEYGEYIMKNGKKSPMYYDISNLVISDDEKSFSFIGSIERLEKLRSNEDLVTKDISKAAGMFDVGTKRVLIKDFKIIGLDDYLNIEYKRNSNDLLKITKKDNQLKFYGFTDYVNTYNISGNLYPTEIIRSPYDESLLYYYRDDNGYNIFYNGKKVGTYDYFFSPDFSKSGSFSFYVLHGSNPQKAILIKDFKEIHNVNNQLNDGKRYLDNGEAMMVVKETRNEGVFKNYIGYIGQDSTICDNLK